MSFHESTPAACEGQWLGSQVFLRLGGGCKPCASGQTRVLNADIGNTTTVISSNSSLHPLLSTHVRTTTASTRLHPLLHPLERPHHHHHSLPTSLLRPFPPRHTLLPFALLTFFPLPPPLPFSPFLQTVVVPYVLLRSDEVSGGGSSGYQKLQLLRSLDWNRRTRALRSLVTLTFTFFFLSSEHRTLCGAWMPFWRNIHSPLRLLSF